MTSVANRASSESRYDFHFVYSTASKILARSRGLDSSEKLFSPKSDGDAAEMNGQNAAAATLEILHQHVDVFGMVDELVVADQRPVGLAAGRAELVLVELLEQLALVELDRPVQVLEQLPLGDVEHLDLQLGAGLAVHHQVVQAAPGAFHLLELGRVHDGRELLGDLGVEGLDARLDGSRIRSFL